MRQPYAVAILDIQMPGSDGISVLREITAIRPQTRIIMVTAYGTVEMAVEAIKLGACDYVMKPVNFDEMLTKIRQHLRYVELEAENQKLREELNGRFDISQIIGETRVMKQVFETIRKVAPTRSNVLITGESGTGKELVAHAIHALEHDQRRPVHRRQLQCDPGDAARERVVRPQTRQFHLRVRGQERALRDGSRRDAVPRRDRPHVAGLPGQTAPRRGTEADHAGRARRRRSISTCG